MASENEVVCEALESSHAEASSVALVPDEAPTVQITKNFQGAMPKLISSHTVTVLIWNICESMRFPRDGVDRSASRDLRMTKLKQCGVRTRVACASKFLLLSCSPEVGTSSTKRRLICSVCGRTANE